MHTNTHSHCTILTDWSDAIQDNEATEILLLKTFERCLKDISASSVMSNQDMNTYDSKCLNVYFVLKKNSTPSTPRNCRNTRPSRRATANYFVLAPIFFCKMRWGWVAFAGMYLCMYTYIFVSIFGSSTT